MRRRPLPITETAPRCLKRCHFCFHYHESGMSGDASMGYCFRWTGQSKRQVLVRRNEVCPQFFRSIPIVSLLWGGVELEILKAHGSFGTSPWTTTKREEIGDSGEEAFKSRFAFWEVVHRQNYQAYIEVNIHKISARHQVVESLPANPKREKWATNRESHPAWADAALSGIDEALEMANARTNAFYRVELVEIRAKDENAAVDVIQCAAALSVLCGLFQNDHQVTAVFDEFEWSLCENPDYNSRKHFCQIFHHLIRNQLTD